VLLRYFRYRRLVGLAEDLDHLVFGESGLVRGLLALSGAILSDSAGPKIARQVRSEAGCIGAL